MLTIFRVLSFILISIFILINLLINYHTSSYDLIILVLFVIFLYSASFYIVILSCKFSIKQIKNFNVYETKLFVLLIDDVLSYEIKRPSWSTIKKALNIFNHYFASSFIRADFLFKLTVYLYVPNLLINKNDLIQIRIWIKNLNTVFLGSNKLSLEANASFKKPLEFENKKIQKIK